MRRVKTPADAVAVKAFGNALCYNLAKSEALNKMTYRS